MSVDPFDYLFSLEQFGIKFGLENIRAIVGALGHPERAFKSVHIAGTNGKGSVTAMVDAILRAGSYRSARYTSPHLVDLSERFVIDGAPVARQQLREVIAFVRDAVEALQAARTLEVHPTFFEVTTAVAFEVFRRASIDVAVCEVGLGGRLDATNVLTPEVTAITSIGLDHQQYLGATLQEIAAEKAGIIKPAVPVVVGRVDQSAATVIDDIAEERRAPIVWAHNAVTVERIQSGAGVSTLRLETPRTNYGALEVGLAGDHQIDNAVVAVRIAEELAARGFELPDRAIADGLKHVRWPGRLEQIRLSDGREVLLDAAHNPDGAQSLGRFLANAGRKRPLVLAVMRDKDVAGILDALLPVVSSIVVTRASHPRSAEPEAIVELVRKMAPALPVSIARSLPDALSNAWTHGPVIVVAGSIFLLGDVLKELGRS